MYELTTTQLSIITLLAIWDLVWKGFALWKAGRNNDKLWFVLLLILNTLGILPIIYIFFVSKGKTTGKE